MSDVATSPEISHDPERCRYELRLDDRLVGVADYRREGGVVSFTHTGVEPAYRGRGLAGQLVEFALRDLRAQDLQALPYCWYVSDYIGQHPEHLDLVPAERRGEFGL